MSSHLMKRVEFSLPRETVALLRQSAEKQHVSVEEYVCDMLTKMAQQQVEMGGADEQKQESSSRKP